MSCGRIKDQICQTTGAAYGLIGPAGNNIATALWAAKVTSQMPKAENTAQEALEKEVMMTGSLHNEYETKKYPFDGQVPDGAKFGIYDEDINQWTGYWFFARRRQFRE